MAWFSGRKGQHTHTTGEEQRLEAGYTLMRRLTIFDKGEKFSSETVFYFLMSLSQIDIQMQIEPVPIYQLRKITGLM